MIERWRAAALDPVSQQLWDLCDIDLSGGREFRIVDVQIVSSDRELDV